MGKAIGAAVAVIVVVAIAGVGFYLTQNFDRLIKGMVEDIGTESVGTQVKVMDLKLSLTEGSGTMSGLTIANPQGFSSDNLFRMDTIELAIDPASLTRDVYVVKSIVIDGATVLAEQVGGGTNLRALQNGMEKQAQSSSSEQDEAAGNVRLAVNTVRFTNGSVVLRSDVLGERSLTLPDFTLSELGTPENGLTPEELGREMSRQLIGQVTDSVSDEISSLAREAAAEKMKEKLGEGVEKLKGLFKKKE